MSKKNGTGNLVEFQFPQPKAKQSFSELIYNSKDGTYFGRTPSSWGKIALFYIIFYIVLAGLFTICMQGLLSTINLSEPKWKLERSLIGTNPGLGFRPISDEPNVGSLIKYSTKKSGEVTYWVDQLNDFLKPYTESRRTETVCSFDSFPKSNKVCMVDINSFGPCSKANKYGFEAGRPCVFIKLNKIFNWEPIYYDKPNDLPENMPEDLKQHILNTTETERQKIWVSCEGKLDVDKERIGEIEYYPSRGFPAYYYPFKNQPDYISPLIAVQFTKLNMSLAIGIECRAWAKNIIYSGSKREPQGSIQFQLSVH